MLTDSRLIVKLSFPELSHRGYNTNKQTSISATGNVAITWEITMIEIMKDMPENIELADARVWIAK